MPDEDRDFAIPYFVADKLGGSGGDEKLVVVDIDPGHLFAANRILYRKGMKPVLPLQRAQVFGCRVEQADPDEFGTIIGTMDLLRPINVAHPFAVPIKDCGHYAHHLSPLPRLGLRRMGARAGDLPFVERDALLVPDTVEAPR